MNEGGNSGENQGAVNDQLRRMSSSFANLLPPRGKVSEKICEAVVHLIRCIFPCVHFNANNPHKEEINK
nr:hypothetical protein CFP56_17318 [Quercus suber]